MPGIWASFGRSRLMISSAVLVRSWRGEAAQNTLPALRPDAPRAPQLDIIPSTSGSRRMISVTSRWWQTIDSKEMPWIASVKPRTWPVSSVGMKPLEARR